MSTKNPKTQTEWRFTYETQSQIPILRLYLINPSINPLFRLRNLRTSLKSHLEVTWVDSETSEEVSVEIPIPKVLVDFEKEFECRCRNDCVEIKIGLVLPVDHKIVMNLMRMETVDMGGIDSELEKLSKGDVHFFCKACSTRLTKQPIRHFKEMPSVDWREVADNWFGACCCSFGGISEKLVFQYVKNYECVEGTCLLDSASANVCVDDVEGCTFLQSYNNHIDVVIKKINSEIDDDYTFENRIAERKISDFEYKHENHIHNIPCLDQLSLNETRKTSSEESVDTKDLSKPNAHSRDKLCSTEHHHCCTSDISSEAKLRPEIIQKWLHDCSLGSGFITRNSHLSNDVEWNDFLCMNCSSVLGAYPSYKNKDVPVDGGIRLFKCYISTSVPIGGPYDIFRNYTLERMFVTSLLEGAKDELSYRVVLRDLKTKLPMIQFVLLNFDTWSSTGYCLENVGVKQQNGAKLQPTVKVLFSHCRTDPETSTRMIKDWCSKTHTEEIYMMTHIIEDLANCLKSAADQLPKSCSSLQGMSLSSMKR